VENQPPPLSAENAALEDEIMNLLMGGGEEEAAEEEAEKDSAPAAKTPAEKPEPKLTSTSVKMAPQERREQRTSSSVDLGDQFSIKPNSAPKTVARVQAPIKPIEPPKLRTSGGNQVVNSIANMFNEAQNSEQLLTDLLSMLVDKGPFKKTALIVVSKDRKHAIVVAARGIGNGQRVELDDPLSPLAQCFSKVQSFGTKSNEASPFGSKAFALAPITADHDTPVALYADCGNDGSITFEARRIFRTVVDILNEKLPSIPGGIPVELAS
jgi:hypothetical protein